MSAAVRVNGMGNQKKQHRELSQWKPEDAAIATEPESPQPKRYVPPEHQGCMALRRNASERYGEVRSTQTVNTTSETVVTRYCHCRFCGASYQDVTVIRK